MYVSHIQQGLQLGPLHDFLLQQQFRRLFRVFVCSPLLLCTLADYRLIASDVYRKLFQRPGRRPRDVPAVQIEMPVVAGAPDMAEIGSVLDDASEVRADRRKGPKVSFRSPH
jgi:hypothetical protein